MKRLSRLFALGLVALLVGCGSEAPEAQVPDATPPPADASVPSVEESAPDAQTAASSSLILPDLLPGDVAPEDPLPARELRDAVMALIGQTVTVQGEAASAFSPRGPAIRMSADPGNVDAPFVECVFPAEAEGSLPSGNATILGTIGQPNLAGQQKLTMTDCSVVESAAEALSVAELADRIVGWIGTEVSVVGTYNGATTSRLRDGEVVELRVQEDGTEGLAEQLVTCQMPAGRVAPELPERNGILFRGTIGGDAMFWGEDKAVLLSDCLPVPR